MFKKISLVLVVLVLFSGVALAGGVTDVNNGNKGDILVSTGENNGANSVGEWTDSSFLKGKDGLNGKNGIDGKTPVKGVDYNDGQSIKGDTGASGKGLENRVEGIVEVRILDTKKTTWSIYGGCDFNNKVNIIGAKLTIKIGKSYIDKKIEQLEKRLNLLESVK